MRSGGIYLDSGRLWYAGIGGDLWSSVALSKHQTGTTTPSAYIFGIFGAGVSTSLGPYNRWTGFLLR